MRNLLPTALMGALCLCASIYMQLAVTQESNNSKLITNRSSSLLQSFSCALTSTSLTDIGIYNCSYIIDKHSQSTLIESVKI